MTINFFFTTVVPEVGVLHVSSRLYFYWPNPVFSPYTWFDFVHVSVIRTKRVKVEKRWVGDSRSGPSNKRGSEVHLIQTTSCTWVSDRTWGVVYGGRSPECDLLDDFGVQGNEFWSRHLTKKGGGVLPCPWLLEVRILGVTGGQISIHELTLSGHR